MSMSRDPASTGRRGLIRLTRTSQFGDESNEQVILEQFSCYVTPFGVPCGGRVATRGYRSTLGIAVSCAVVLRDAPLALWHIVDIESPQTINRLLIQDEFPSLLIPLAILKQPCSRIHTPSGLSWSPSGCLPMCPSPIRPSRPPRRPEGSSPTCSPNPALPRRPP
jgi:hypothetical protein